jgi:hypothetical protein
MRERICACAPPHRPKVGDAVQTTELAGWGCFRRPASQDPGATLDLSAHAGDEIVAGLGDPMPSTIDTIPTVLDEAGFRLHKIQFAVRNGQWWEARVLLAEADAAQDWTALGHASAEVYHARALGLHAAAGEPLPGRFVG